MADQRDIQAIPGAQARDQWLYLDLLMPESLLDAIGERAQQHGQVFNEFIGQAVETYLNHPQSSAQINAGSPDDAEGTGLTVRRPIALRETPGARLVAQARAQGLAADTLLLRILRAAVATE